MEIRKPRRILILNPPNAGPGVLSLLKDLTGSAPDLRVVPVEPATNTETDSSKPSSKVRNDTEATTAGLSHILKLVNAYYHAEIPIWLDEPSDINSWHDDFLSDEANDVVRAIGAWVVVFRREAGLKWHDDAQQKLADLLDAINNIIKSVHGIDAEAWEGVCLAVGIPGRGLTGGAKSIDQASEAWSKDEYMEFCIEKGFEYVEYSGKQGSTSGRRDEFGELQGVDRIREALEANEWEDTDGVAEELKTARSNELEFGSWTDAINPNESDGFALERSQMESEFASLKMSLNTEKGEEDEEGEIEVEEFERMMSKVLAIKDMTAHLPQQERKRVAAKAVSDMMKSP